MMLKALAAALLLASSAAVMAETYDPCISVSRQVAAVAHERDSGTRMVDLIKAAHFENDDDEELYLKLVALAYGNPDMSAATLEENTRQACEDEG